MKKILVITGVFLPEPIVSARLMADLAEELSKKYDVTVLRPHPSRPMGFKVPAYDFKDKPYKVVEIDAYVCPASSFIGRFRESISYGEACIRYLEPIKNEIDFIYNGAWHMFGRSIVAKSALKYGIPYITPVQDIYPESLSSKLPNIPLLKQLVNKILLPSDRSLLSKAVLIHTISDKMVDYLSKTRNIDKSHFVAVRNWQDERDFVEYANTHQNEKEVDVPFTFMYMGNVGPLAGIEVLFDALREAQLPNARLVVAGSGSAKQSLMEKAKSYKDCNIEFWDVPSGKVPETQSKADVMCLPVKKGYAMSSIPSKLPAYMFSKKPVLASVDYESDTAACIRDNNAGWVALPEDVHSIACAMKSAAALSKDELTIVGNNGFEFAIDNLSRSKNLPRLVNACVRVFNNVMV